MTEPLEAHTGSAPQRQATMANDQSYAGGLLNRALDPVTQPPEIRVFLEEEIRLLREFVARGRRVIDIGCGTGRHLAMLRDELALGVGVDYQHAYLLEAQDRAGGPRLHFVAADATALPVAAPFDLAICTTNTWGTMSDKAGVLREMRRVAPESGHRLLAVYGAASVPARCEWYRRLGHQVREVTDEFILTDEGFRSEHFTEARIRELVGDCSIRRYAEIGFLVTF